MVGSWYFIPFLTPLCESCVSHLIPWTHEIYECERMEYMKTDQQTLLPKTMWSLSWPSALYTIHRILCVPASFLPNYVLTVSYLPSPLPSAISDWIKKDGFWGIGEVDDKGRRVSTDLSVLVCSENLAFVLL